jgi:crotonobetainyl-CoA:carnitine CoA-transferase CaiB-like acyl-CoA transferase
VSALEGIVVADLSRVLAGPYATMLMADLGATVIKVERPGAGDDTRAWGPPWAGGVATYFASVNRGKASVALDLADPSDRERALALCRRADVVVENFRPGTLDRLGLGYDDVSGDNPRVVYCSITGFGSDKGAALSGYDLLVQAVGGLMSVTGHSPDDPTKVGVALVDVITGLHALSGVLAALRSRDVTGHGQRVEVSLLTSLLSALVNQASGFLNAGVVPAAMGNAHPSIAPYEVLATADRPLAVAVGNDKQFVAMCQALGVPGLAADPRFATNGARVTSRVELRGLLEEQLARAGAREWTDRLNAVGVPCGPINGVDEAIELAAELGLEPVVEQPAGAGSVATRQIRCPITLSQTPAVYPSGPPALDSGSEVLERLLSG